MYDKSKNYYSQIIKSEIEELSSDISELEQITKPIPLDSAYGRISRMDAINQKSRNEALLSDARVRMQNLKRVLVNIEGGEYGVCSVCGNEISKERLEFVPETDRCNLHTNQ